MKKLVYVDAENISLDSLLKVIKSLNKNSDDIVIGKVYGNKNVLNNIIDFSIKNGFEFIDTSIIYGTKKNLTDMKLITDCMFDVLIGYYEKAEVVIVSNDCDFIPVANKLAGLGIKVITPLLCNSDEYRLDITSYFKCIGFQPAKEDKILLFQLGDLMKRGDGVSSDFERRRLRLCKDLNNLVPNEKINELINIPLEKFCFNEVLKRTNSKFLQEIASIYVRKIFGITLTSEVLMNRIVTFRREFMNE